MLGILVCIEWDCAMGWQRDGKPEICNQAPFKCFLDSWLGNKKDKAVPFHASPAEDNGLPGRARVHLVELCTGFLGYIKRWHPELPDGYLAPARGNRHHLNKEKENRECMAGTHTRAISLQRRTQGVYQ